MNETTLQWNKPERVTLKENMIVSYRSVSQWCDKGKLLSWDGRMAIVQWPRVKSTELLDNLYIWSEQETDQRDTWSG